MSYECDNGHRQIVLVVLFICFLVVVFIQKTQITGLVVSTEDLGAFNQVIEIGEIFIVMIALGIISGCFAYAHNPSFLKKIGEKNTLPVFSLKEFVENKRISKLKDEKISIMKKVHLHKEIYYSASHYANQQKKKCVKWFKKKHKSFTINLHQLSHDFKIIIREIVGYVRVNNLSKFKKKKKKKNKKKVLVVRKFRSKNVNSPVLKHESLKKDKNQILQDYENEIERKLVKMSFGTGQEIIKFKETFRDIDTKIMSMIKEGHNRTKIIYELGLLGFSKKIVMRHYKIIKEMKNMENNKGSKTNKNVELVRYSKNSTKFDRMIVKYIMEGMSKEQIKRILLNSGWPKSFVKEHYEELHKEFEKEVMKMSEEDLKGDQLNLLESHLQKELDKINRI